MKTKRFLIVIAVIVLLTSIPAFAEEKGFVGLIPATAQGLYIGASNLDVAVVALATQPVETIGGGLEYLCIAGDAVTKTACMLTEGCVGGLYIAGTNLDVAAVALATKPVETIFGGLDLLCAGGDAILRCLFGG